VSKPSSTSQLPCFTFTLSSHFLSHRIEVNLLSCKTAEPTHHTLAVIVTLLILMLHENGSRDSKNRPYPRSSEKPRFLNLVGPADRKPTSMLTAVMCDKAGICWLFWRTDSKATTAWDLYALYPHVPKVLHQGLRESRYYVSSSDSLKIHSDSSRGQSENKAETHQRLFDEILRIYKQRVPGITPPEQLKRIEQL
jgi:hypothetical protein